MLTRNITYRSENYEVELIREGDGGYSARVPGFPGPYSDGDTDEGALESIADAIAMLKEKGQSIRFC